MKAAILERLGTPGVVGLGILLFCLSFYLGNLAPMGDELAALESQGAQLAAEAATRREGAGAAGAGADRRLPPLVEAPELLKQLDGLAGKYGAVVQRASYQLTGKEGPLRLEVSMPLKMTYPSLRAYLRDALALTASASLDELNLQRPQATDAMVEAQVRLSFGFAAAP